MNVYEKECLHQGVDPKKVASIARRMQRAMKDADELGLMLFGGTWGASIRGDDELILAHLDGCPTSGGCGAESKDHEGLRRGER